MTGVSDVVVAALLVIGGLAASLAAIGVAVARDPFDRLHYTGAATSAASVSIGSAAVLAGLQAAAAAELVLVVLLLFLGGPLVSHALARAFRVRGHGQWDAETGVTRAKELDP